MLLFVSICITDSGDIYPKKASYECVLINSYVGVLVVYRILLKEMDTVFRVQILVKDVYFSHSANIL